MSANGHGRARVFCRNPKLAWREIDGEIVIISPEDSSVHELNETAGMFWRSADGKRDVDEIVRELASLYEAPVELVRADVDELILDLTSKNLLVDSLMQVRL